VKKRSHFCTGPSDVIQPEGNGACWEKNCIHIHKKAENGWAQPTEAPPPNHLLLVSLAGLKGHLQDFISQSVPVQAVDRHGGLLVVRHGDEAEAFALVGVEISNHFHVDDGAERPEHLPQNGLVCVLAQVIDEDTPAAGGAPRDSAPSAHVVHAHGRKPEGVQRNT